jgi:hypothetical protein
MGFWSNIEAVRWWATWTPYIFIVVGGLIAGGGRFIGSKFDARVKVLEVAAAKAAELSRRATPPDFDAILAVNPMIEPMLVITTKNLIPFKAKWLFTYENNTVVDGIIPLGWTEIHPQKVPERFTSVEQQARVAPGEVIELRLDFESAYAAEVRDAPGLSGRLVRRYRQKADGTFEPIPP